MADVIPKRKYCKRGHEQTAENVIASFSTRWYAKCRVCQAIRHKTWTKENKNRVRQYKVERYKRRGDEIRARARAKNAENRLNAKARRGPGYVDITWQRFGRLVALFEVDGGHWMCKCDCGNYHRALKVDLTRGHTKSCGCFVKEAAQARRTYACPKCGDPKDKPRDSTGRLAGWCRACSRKAERSAQHRAIAELHESYVRKKITRSLKLVAASEIPSEMVAAKAAHLKVVRLLKEMKHK